MEMRSDGTCSILNGEPNGCNRPEGTCKLYDMLQDFADELNEYYATGYTPGQIKDFDQVYLDKCKEVNKLNAEMGKSMK